MLDNFNWIAFVALIVASLGVYGFTTERKWPFLLRILSPLLTFIAIFTIFFFLYKSVGFPAWMIWPAQFILSNSSEKLFIKPGFYSIDIAGWQHHKIQDGDVFVCSICSDLIQVEITYGPELSNDAKYKSNKEFIDSLNTEEEQKKIADLIIRNSIPFQTGFTISVEKVGLTQIGGLDVFQFNSVVEISLKITHDNRMVAIHKNRIMMITLNYFEGGMNSTTKYAIDRLYNSLHFF